MNSLIMSVKKYYATKDNTITNLVNEVVIIKMAGAKVKIVSKNIICSVVATCWGELAESTEIFIPGIGVCA